MSVEFFRFVRGVQTWRYSSLAESIVADGHTWLPAPLRRSQVDVSTELEKSSVNISAGRDFAPVSVFAGTSPVAPTYVTLYRANLADLAATFGAFWHGQVASVQWSGSFAEIACQPSLALLRRPSPRKRYSTTCRWALYDSGCGVDRNAISNYRTGEVLVVNSATSIVISTYEDASPDADNWAAGGTLTLTGYPDEAPQTVISSTVSVIVGAVRERTIELARPMENMGSLEPIRLQRGCGHTLSDCAGFVNVPRFGGFPYMPKELAP